MSVDKGLGKQRLEVVESLAKACGVELMAWNDTTGGEFACVSGPGDKLRTFEQQMVGAGWISWPVDGTLEGSYMEFAMRPPTAAEIITPTNHEVVVRPDYVSQQFRYRGPTSGYLSGWAMLGTILAFLGYRLTAHSYFTTPPAQIAFAVAVLVLVACVLLPFHLVEVEADGVSVRYRSLLRGRKSVAVPDIEAVSLYADDPEKDPKGMSVLIVLRSGLRIDLYLPARERMKLVAFLKGKLSPLPPRQS